MSFEDELRLALAAKSVEIERRAPDVSEIERRASLLADPWLAEPGVGDADDTRAVMLLPTPGTANEADVTASTPRGRARRVRSRLAASSVGVAAAAAVIVVVALLTFRPGAPETDVYISPADRSDTPNLIDETNGDTDTPGEAVPDADHEVQQGDQPSSAATPTGGNDAEGSRQGQPSTNSAPTPSPPTPTPTPFQQADDTAGHVPQGALPTSTTPTLTPTATPTAVPAAVPSTAATEAPTATPTEVVRAEAPTATPATARTCPEGEFEWTNGDCYPIPVTPSPTSIVETNQLRCPTNATEVNGECREAIAMIPAPKSCEAGYSIIGTECALVVASTVERTCDEGVLVTEPTLACEVTYAAVEFDEATDSILCDGGATPNATAECTRYENVTQTVACAQGAIRVDDQCLLYGAAPTNSGDPLCPVGPGIIADPCYRVVDPLS